MKKLVLKKKVIQRLSDESMSPIKGGTGGTCVGACVTMTCTTENITSGECFHTIGHDDGPECVSKTDWGWCWCYGV